MTKLNLNQPNAPVALVEYSPRGFANETFCFLVAPNQIEAAKATLSELSDNPNAYISLNVLKESPDSRKTAGLLLLQWYEIPEHEWNAIYEASKQHEWEWNPATCMIKN